MRTAKALGIVVLVGAAVAAGWMLIGCRSTDPVPNQHVQNARKLIGDLRQMFEAGRLELAGPNGDAPPQRGDSRLALLGGLMEKLRYRIEKYETDPARKAAAVAKIKEFNATFSVVAEKYQPAVDAGKHAVAAELVPHMRTLETRLDELETILQGRRS